MRSTLQRALLASLCAVAANAQAPNTRPSGAITVRVDGRPTTISAADLARLTHHDYRVANDNGADSSTVSGVTLWDVLQKVGAPNAEASGRQRAAMYVRLTGADGQTAVFALVEIDPGFSRRTVVLADHRDGKPLDAVEGPWRAIVPDDQRHARWIRGLVDIEVGTLKPPSPEHTANGVLALPPARADSDEIALGAALLMQFDADRGVEATPQSRRIEAYLQRVADSLGRHTNRKLPWHIHYDPHPGVKSGFALPGGHIVVWGGVVGYMSTEDELAAIIAHEIEHTDDGQVAHRIDSLTAAGHRDLRNAKQWSWREFGATYGETLEKVCDFDGARLAVKAGYSPFGLKMLLESFIAIGKVHAPAAPPNKAIVDRITQIDGEIASEHWETLTKTRPLRLP